MLINERSARPAASRVCPERWSHYDLGDAPGRWPAARPICQHTTTLELERLPLLSSSAAALQEKKYARANTT